MGVVNINLEVDGASRGDPQKLNREKFSQGLSAKILVLENF